MKSPPPTVEVPTLIWPPAATSKVIAATEYRPGYLLGEVVGELVPNLPRQSWSLYLCRNDLDDREHSVVQVHFQHVGNWTRGIKHVDSLPNVRFVSMAVSGRWRIMVRAIDFIPKGECLSVKWDQLVPPDSVLAY